MQIKRLLWLIPLLFVSHAFAQTNWYVNATTGSNDTNCTGKSNTPYVSGTAQPCPFVHPFYLLNTSGAWRIAGGDIVNFTDTGSSQNYYIGEQNAGIGTDWHTRMSGICPVVNGTGSGAGFACTFPSPPSGTSGSHTKIIGQNSGSCHDSSHTHLVNPTVLTGIGNVEHVLDFSGTNFVDVSCIEVTQYTKCTNVPATSGGVVGCNNHFNDTFNFVGGGGGGGIVLNNVGRSVEQFGPTNLTMNDVAVVGISSSGILGANGNHAAPSTGINNFTDIYVIGNGLAGWNGDGNCGNGSTACEDQGIINHSNIIVDWNGCIPAVYPYDMTKADTALGFDWCTDSNVITSTASGYGDGLVIIAAGNVTENYDHAFFRWNTQDGFDGLHLSDDATTSPNINVTTSWSEGNMGATFKIGGATTTSAINNVSIGNCRVLGTASNFPLNPTNWNTNLSLLCRASGDEWTFQMNNTSTVTVENNTSVGYGATMYDLECNTFTTPPNTNCSTSGGKINFNNNISKGYADPSGGALAAGFFFGSGVTTTSFSNGAHNNLWNTMRAGTGCPDSAITSPVPVNSQCGDPLLVGESNINAINPNLTGSSPAIAHGEFISGITTDYNGATRPNPPAIGAFEFSGTGAVATPTALPVAGTYSSTQSVVLSTATAGATICFTTNGTTPAATTPGTCSTGTPYTTAISVATTQTIMAIGTLVGDTNSSVATFAYTITPPTVATPTASPTAGTYSSTQSVALTTTTSGATICFTINGTTPAATTPGTCSTGTTYTTAISVATSQTIMALGTKSGDTNSSVASFVYVIAPLVATPTCSPAAGTYSSTQTVTCSSATSGATICGTTNGSTPTSSPAGTCSNGTSGPFTISTTITLKVIGTKLGDTDSSVLSGLYTITGSPITNMIINGSITLRNIVVQ